jgi:hypothetical protein
MASAQDTNVLLETVEICSYQGAKSPQIGSVQKGGNTDSIEPKGAMASRSLVSRLPARTLATQASMTNKWLAEQGLISVKEQWVKIHYPASARRP